MKSLLAVAVAVALSVSAAARAGSLLDIRVIDRDTGATLPLHRHHGNLYVAGTPGHRYAVRLHNRTGARVLTVLSVDGINAITGQTANPSQSGYVLDAYATTLVDGWRKNMAEVAEFNFTALGDSYAARTGRPGNVGVIGVAVFREKVPLRRKDEDEIASREGAPRPATADAGAARGAEPGAPASSARPETAKSLPAPAGARDSRLAARQAQPEESLGTGHGSRRSSYARYTTFVRANPSPDEIDSIWYDSWRNLVARGVIPQPRPIAVEPQPFPNSGFVPDPAG